MPKTIGNPLSWTLGAFSSAAGYAADMAGQPEASTAPPQTRILTMSDLRLALGKGWDDLAAMRSDVVFACLLYPLMGAVLLAIAARGDFVHLLFPVLSGFALIGPVAALGLYQMSRKREAGLPVSWLALLDVMKSPRFPRILLLSGLNGVIFLAWLLIADAIHAATLGGATPTDVTAFVTSVVATPAGWAMAIIGTAAGFVLAVVVLAVCAISFPLLLDRDVSLPVAVITSVRVARENPVVIAAWGAIVAGGLVIGTLPALLGLVVVLPLLGHATWHLYRVAVD